ncbi:MAG: tryptophan-rich sensory protein [Candidatus ainarchaeum sp.]|nr:tryptophan-rich sensory protein [Candidatus ainarchaeum sp.]MDD3976029.1 tryptophan-rich sensory protein [Candidatus ainarchaeum sp.]
MFIYKKLNKLTAFIISVIFIFITAIIGSIFTTRNIPTWYQTINLPFLVPPSFIFPIVWNILFILMIISFYIILKTYNKNKSFIDLRKSAINFFIIQLILNFLWVILFFEFNFLFISLIEIVILEVFIILTINKFSYINRTASRLLLPYVLWIFFAMILNFLVFLLN